MEGLASSIAKDGSDMDMGDSDAGDEDSDKGDEDSGGPAGKGGDQDSGVSKNKRGRFLVQGNDNCFFFIRRKRFRRRRGLWERRGGRGPRQRSLAR